MRARLVGNVQDADGCSTLASQHSKFWLLLNTRAFEVASHRRTDRLAGLAGLDADHWSTGRRLVNREEAKSSMPSPQPASRNGNRGAGALQGRVFHLIPAVITVKSASGEIAPGKALGAVSVRSV